MHNYSNLLFMGISIIHEQDNLTPVTLASDGMLYMGYLRTRWPITSEVTIALGSEEQVKWVICNANWCQLKVLERRNNVTLDDEECIGEED